MQVCLLLTSLFINLWIICVEILWISLILNAAQAFSESLEMHDLTHPQETDRISHFRILHDPQDIVVGQTCLLLCCHILVEVGDGISGALELAGAEWLSAGSLRPDGEGVVNIIFVKAGSLDLLWSKIFGELVDDGCHDLQVAEFLRANVSKCSCHLAVLHGIPL